jgi:hypothetical protein
VHALARIATRAWTAPAARALSGLAGGVGLGFLVAGVQTFPLAALVSRPSARRSPSMRSPSSRSPG